MTGALSTSELRVSDAERDDVVSRLSEHFQAGRLTADEFDERAGLAIGAKTRGDLTSLMTDLPGGQALARPTAEAAADSGQAVQPHRRLTRTAPVLVMIAAIAVVASLLGHGVAGHVPWGLLLVALFVFRGSFRGHRRARQ